MAGRPKPRMGMPPTTPSSCSRAAAARTVNAIPKSFLASLLLWNPQRVRATPAAISTMHTARPLEAIRFSSAAEAPDRAIYSMEVITLPPTTLPK